jgi:hypothetical protein
LGGCFSLDGAERFESSVYPSRQPPPAHPRSAPVYTLAKRSGTGERGCSAPSGTTPRLQPLPAEITESAPEMTSALIPPLADPALRPFTLPRANHRGRFPDRRSCDPIL